MKHSGKYRAVVTTSVYGEYSSALEMLDAAGFIVDRGWIGRPGKPDRDELIGLIGNCDVVIAGTEPYYSADVLQTAPELKFISRVGIGLDGIDFGALAERNIEIAYTPDAVTRSVSEFTVGLALSLARHISQADRVMHSGGWTRYVGVELAGKRAGIIGFGRVGRTVAPILKALGMEVMVNDIAPDAAAIERTGCSFAEKSAIYSECDLVLLHVPLTNLTRGLIDKEELGLMKSTALLVNTSRGPIISEAALHSALAENRIAGAALDVFTEEPYSGPLAKLDNVLLTCHMGSCSKEGRRRMEEESARNVIAFFNNQPDYGRVPNSERCQAYTSTHLQVLDKR